MQSPIMRAGDVNVAADVTIAAINSLAHSDWTRPAGELAWSCRRTLDHIVDALAIYSAAVALPVLSRDEWVPTRNGDDEATVADLLLVLQREAAVLEKVCEASPPPARAFHPSAMSDADGFRAMGCSEILIHTDDILLGIGDATQFQPSPDLCDRILRRVFPWAPDARECPDRWLALKWACGRIALPDHPRLNEKWWWHAAPIVEWDGTRNERDAPPAWT